MGNERFWKQGPGIGIFRYPVKGGAWLSSAQVCVMVSSRLMPFCLSDGLVSLSNAVIFCKSYAEKKKF